MFVLCMSVHYDECSRPVVSVGSIRRNVNICVWSWGGLFVEVGYFKSAFIEFVVIECGFAVVFVVKAEVEA